ncbi:MAG: bacteriohemerythrin [Sedimenticola sp.]
MAYLDWKEELETGIDIIDTQHKRIVDYINQLHDIARGESDTEVSDVIIALVDYTLSHFVFEESLLEEAGYEKSAEHIREHDAFRNKIFAFKAQATEGGDVAPSLLKLLNDWLFTHIQEEDGQYVTTVRLHLEQQEIKPGWLKKQADRFFK